MAKAHIKAGNCGFYADVEAKATDGFLIDLKIESDCRHIQRLAENLEKVDALNEISFRKGMPETLQKGAEYCTHASCPVPVGIIKAIEVEAGLAMPQEASIEVTKDS